MKLAQTLASGEQLTPGLRNRLGQLLTNGNPGSKGQPIYETVTDKNTGKKTQQKVLNPDGTPKMTSGSPKIAPVDNVLASAALDMVFDGHVSPQNVKRLHTLGYTVRDFPGLRTFSDRAPSPTSTAPPGGRTAPGVNGQSRPT